MKKTSLVLLITAIFLIGSIVLNAATYTVINSADAGAGSLRQAIMDANTNPGLDTIDFAIPLADPNYSNWTGTGDFWWKITLASNLPAIEEDLVIDGLSQSINIADSNPGAVGTGGTVGVDAIALPLYEKLEIEIDANDVAEPMWLALGTNNVLIEGICIFNSTGDAMYSHGESTGDEIRKCFLGTRADGSEPAAGLKNEKSGIRISYTSGMSQNIATIDECYLAYNGHSGVIGTRNNDGAPTWPYIGATIIVEYCEAFENGWNSDDQDGIDGNGANNVIRFNLAYNNRSIAPEGAQAGSGSGIEVGGYSDIASNTNNEISNNTSYGNDNHGIVLLRRPTGDIITKNIVRNNGGPGILVTNRHYYDAGFGIHTYTRYNQITQNSIYDNDGLGIDLCHVEWDNYINGDEVTINNGTYDTDRIFANEDIDFPVITKAEFCGGDYTQLILEGYVGSAPDQAVFVDNTVEFFISSYDGVTNPNPDVSNDSHPYHGEGKTFFGSLITDALGNFSGVIDITGYGVSVGTWITATSTDLLMNTSEFGENKLVEDCELPVTLSSFTGAYSSAGFVSLSWITQSESNMNLYNLYRTDVAANNEILINTQAANNESGQHNYSYQDQNVYVGSTYEYWLEAVDLDGTSSFYGPTTVDIIGEDAPDIISTTKLSKNYPNPFNPSTKIDFAVKTGETGSFTIFNTKGQVLETKEFTEGNHSYTWDASNYGSGIYFYKLQSDTYSEVKKMIMIK